MLKDPKKSIITVTQILAFVVITGASYPCPDVKEIFPCSCTSVGEDADRTTTIDCNEDFAYVEPVLEFLSISWFSFDRLVISKPSFTNLKSKSFGNMRFSRLDLDASKVENVSTDALYGQVRALTHLRLRCLSTDLEFIKPLENLVYFSTVSPEYRSCKTAGITFSESMFSNVNLNYLSHLEVLTSSKIENGAFSGLKKLSVLKIYCKKVDHCYNNISNDIGWNNKLRNLALRNLDSKEAKIPQLFMSLLPDGTNVDLSESKISKVNEAIIAIAIRKNLKLDLKGNEIECGCELKFASLYNKLSPQKELLDGQCQWHYENVRYSIQTSSLMNIENHRGFKSLCGPVTSG